ncbi:MAG: hypothetical protein J7501_16280, partial [Bdellovibrio sp.]|nr:hypothetical protein [Bdellovibrio sp.]
MKRILLLVFATILSSCATNSQSPQSMPTAQHSATGRAPTASTDLTGTYLGEGLFAERSTGLRRPAYRLYLDRAQGESDTYYGVLLEYDQLLNMGLPYLASQKAPFLNHVVGYLDKIATRISAYKFVPGAQPGTYEMHNLIVQSGQIVAQDKFAMTLVISSKPGISAPLAGAVITGFKDGQISFPDVLASNKSDVVSSITEVLNFSQLDLARVVYKKGHLASSWRGNWKDLEGSYLSEYGR